MARPICIWLPSLAAFALSACGGSESGFFSDLPRAGAGGAGHAGATAHAGSLSSSGGSANPGGAGAPTVAGSPGSAGNLGSAGEAQTSAGSGGASSGGTASGGAASGGRAGSNTGGTANHAGSGGSGATGGRAGAPSAGAGGSSQELTCSELLKLANQQLDAARVCNLAANALQCTGTVMNTCNCEVSVQRSDSAETKAYLATLKQLKAKDCVTVCTAIVCRPVSDGDCKSSGSGSSMGICTARSSGPLP
ncbi:MAG TPA: hypothetical protein VFK05_26700 [Polyangiaceae bacterium]|nr:hypothetical protein [Polyangiaceae bacterium]